VFPAALPERFLHQNSAHVWFVQQIFVHRKVNQWTWRSLFVGDIHRGSGIIPRPGVPPRSASIDAGTSVHGDEQPLPGRQHEPSLRGECLADIVARRPWECRAKSVATHREEYPRGPATRYGNILTLSHLYPFGCSRHSFAVTGCVFGLVQPIGLYWFSAILNMKNNNLNQRL
jgi:hypothetical protein